MSLSERPWQGRRLHFIGVGGAGMSGYARAAHALGAHISGSDASSTPYSRRLEQDGLLSVNVGYEAKNLPGGEDLEIFYSSAVPAQSPERLAARERGIPERPRADLLGELSALRRTIAVAGTHGKTTTSSMIVHALRGAGLDPGWLVGSSIGAGLANARWSEGQWLVVEADESDRSMLSLHVEIAVLTNVELDHHATFGSLSELRDAFAEFLTGAKHAVLWNRPELLSLRGDPPESLSGAEEPQPSWVLPYDVPEPTLADGGSRFLWHQHEVRLQVPGAHNALNAAGALEAAHLTGAEDALSIAGLEGFRGAERRFQKVGESAQGAIVYDDYAHHPTEVAATLRAARTIKHQRLIAVFQPHLYSRTAQLAEEFAAALALADIAIVLDIYPARERPEDHPGVSGGLILDEAAKAGEGEFRWVQTLKQAESLLGDLLDSGDLVIVMGAGDVDSLARMLISP